jgi:hypothetical protein
LMVATDRIFAADDSRIVCQQVCLHFFCHY